MTNHSNKPLKIYWNDNEGLLALSGEDMADDVNYEVELARYRAGKCPTSILRILQPGQDISLANAKYCLAEDLSLLIFDEYAD